MDTQTDNVDNASFRPLKLLRTVWRVLLVVLLGMSVVLLWLLLSGKTESIAPDRLPIHRTIPDFRLVNHTGRPFVRQDLSGRIWVANFVFTRCPGVCPVLSAKMSKLEIQLDATGRTSVRLLSFSVDPEWDTPERLTGYAQKHQADLRRWSFLTGDRDTVQQLVTQGFQLSMMNRMDVHPEGSHTDASRQQSLEQIVHSDRFVLIDPEFRIRAHYRGTEEGLIQHVLHDIDLLAREYEIIF